MTHDELRLMLIGALREYECAANRLHSVIPSGLTTLERLPESAEALAKCCKHAAIVDELHARYTIHIEDGTVK